MNPTETQRASAKISVTGQPSIQKGCSKEMIFAAITKNGQMALTIVTCFKGAGPSGNFKQVKAFSNACSSKMAILSKKPQNCRFCPY